MSKFSFRKIRATVAAPAVAGVMALSATIAAPAATAQEIPNLDQLSSKANSDLAQLSSQSGLDDLTAEAKKQLDNFYGQTREQAWNTRNQILDQAEKFSPELVPNVQTAVDGAVEFLFPGLIAQKNEEARKAREAAARANAERVAAEKARSEAAARKAEAQRRANQFDRGPCPADAKVCVDLNGRRTWLQDGGKVSYVSPAMSAGMRGQETPRGTFHVTRKVEHEISREFNNAPMPYSIYFTNNGHAFHLDDPAVDSNGCVHLPPDAAKRYWDNVQVGDKVFIY